MQNAIIARIGEIHLKGGNRGMFLSALVRNMRSRLTNARVEHIDTRILITNFSDAEETMQRVTGTFGITSASHADVLRTDKIDITNHISRLNIKGTFKVEVTRGDKKFPIKSMPFAAEMGALILSKNQEAVVDVIEPEARVCIDIRPQHTFVYTDVVQGVGGIPVGTSGKGMVLLSGGIDSPVSAFLAAKRGLSIDCLHFFSPPYTSEMALKKVQDLAEILRGHVGKINLHVVPFTEIQEEIKNKCAHEYIITLMRRFMIRIASALCESNHCDCIITGENLAQVASQTIQGIASNGYLSGQIPILRPLITYDKAEIIEISKKIGTYKTSVLDFPDCCTAFVPAKPSIRPSIRKLELEEKKLDVDGLVKSAIAGVYKG